ncbi:MAG: hypothetical protein BWK80_21645 [Desulfobacteraceae bacterium IS3]|nr:MAG: hypothetical protein BWK80_21645 [Desulfobacteraceae bacterium IS3]
MNNALLAQEIKAIFQDGLIISPEVLRYINSTFSNPEISELEALLNDESDCEREPLLELIFFPDAPARIRLEPLLERGTFLKDDAQAVSNLLYSEHIRVALRFPDGNALVIKLPEDAASRFISRLNISYKTEERLLDAIRCHIPETLQWAIKVRLRNARHQYSPNKLDFLCRFFEKPITEPDELLECLDFVLNFMTEINGADDIRTALERRKEFHFLAIQKAADFEEQFGRNNMETLMVQGLRMPHIDRAKLMREIVIIDRICYLVYHSAFI